MEHAENLVITEELINKMLEAAQKAGDDVRTLDYKIYKNLESIYKLCLQCDQMNTPKSGAIRTQRVIRVKRFIPNSVINILKSNASPDYLYERVFLSGMFMVVPCVVISKLHLYDMVCDMRGRSKVYDHNKSQIIKDMGVVLAGNTMRMNTDGSAIILEKSMLTDWICAGYQYYMLEV